MTHEPDIEKLCESLRTRALRIPCSVCPAGIDVSCLVYENGHGDVHYRRVIDAALGRRRAN